jgi:hypothetical protein
VCIPSEFKGSTTTVIDPIVGYSHAPQHNFMKKGSVSLSQMWTLLPTDRRLQRQYVLGQVIEIHRWHSLFTNQTLLERKQALLNCCWRIRNMVERIQYICIFDDNSRCANQCRWSWIWHILCLSWCGRLYRHNRIERLQQYNYDVFCTITRLNDAYQEGGVKSSLLRGNVEVRGCKLDKFSILGLTGTRTQIDVFCWRRRRVCLKRAVIEPLLVERRRGNQSYQKSKRCQ